MLVSGVPVSADGQEDADAARRRELGAFLKARRSSLSPAALGLAATPRRRAKGLLREEVAQRAGTSTTWYTWLEQGRDIQASPELVERLAQALLLSDAERRHLHTLSRHPPRKGALTDEAPAALVSWLKSLDPQPAYALNGMWDLIAWNDAASDLLGDLSAVPPRRNNLLRLLFLDPEWRDLFVDWNEVATSSVAQFRLVAANAPASIGMQAFIDDLCRESADFANIWRQGNVAQPELKTKRMRSRRFGEVELSFASVRPEGAPGDVSVTIYSRPSPRPGIER